MRGAQLCTFDQICPNGEQQPPVGGQQDVGDMWAPIRTRITDNGRPGGADEDWVQVGRGVGGVCNRHSNSWGLGHWHAATAAAAANATTAGPEDRSSYACCGLATSCRAGCHRGNGAEYRGQIAITNGGRTCQSWAAQSPHGHSATAEHYPNAGLGDHNFCRNPDGQPAPWCYTTDPNKRWAYCSIPSCEVCPQQMHKVCNLVPAPSPHGSTRHSSQCTSRLHRQQPASDPPPTATALRPRCTALQTPLLHQTRCTTWRWWTRQHAGCGRHAALHSATPNTATQPQCCSPLGRSPGGVAVCLCFLFR